MAGIVDGLVVLERPQCYYYLKATENIVLDILKSRQYLRIFLPLTTSLVLQSLFVFSFSTFGLSMICLLCFFVYAQSDC